MVGRPLAATGTRVLAALAALFLTGALEMVGAAQAAGGVSQPANAASPGPQSFGPNAPASNAPASNAPDPQSPGMLEGPLVIIDLIAESAALTPGRTATVALRQRIRAGWHTYWINPGDSGQPTEIRWELPAGFTAGPIQWPVPKVIPYPPLQNFGFEGEVLLLVDIVVPPDARAGEQVTLTAHATWLVCEKVCIPEEGVARLTLPIAAAGEPPGEGMAGEDKAREEAAAIAAARERLPLSSPWPARFQLSEGGLGLALNAPELAPERVAAAFFFPFADGWIANAAPQTLTHREGEAVLAMTPGYSASTLASAPNARLAGVLAVTEQGGGYRGFLIDAGPGVVPTIAAAGSAAGDDGAAIAAETAALSLAGALALALLGGVVLNLMPCVFPVLSMKAMSLVGKSGHDLAHARAGGLAYTAGVVLSFAALGGALIALKAGGAGIGWGFQLQSPAIVAGLALILFAVGLNLAGVFEVSGRFVGAGSSLAARPGHAGAFFTGVLATLVATPCTAPFMATALGYGLTQPPAVAMLVFIALGLGLALPYLLLICSPSLVRRLPRPGAWMERLKQFLAFPMFASAAWLVWVLAIQAGDGALLALLVAMVLTALAAWLVGHVRPAVNLRWRGVTATAAILAMAGGMALLAASLDGADASGSVGGATAGPVAAAPARTGAPTVGAGPVSEPFSEARLAALRAEGRSVFVNVTAAWCITCLVNERVALSSPDLARFFADRGIVYLKADWTNRDPVIGAYLAKFGRSGLPLYVVYPAGGGAPRLLPQLLTEAIVRDEIGATSPGG